MLLQRLLVTIHGFAALPPFYRGKKAINPFVSNASAPLPSFLIMPCFNLQEGYLSWCAIFRGSEIT
jgi:hypothetical protein